jgi:flagellar protein FlaJ
MSKIKVIAIVIAILLILINFVFLLDSNLFFFVLGLALVIALLPFFTSYLVESGREKEKEEKFLEFARNISENVKSGMPVTKSILVLADKNYGSLTSHIKKLANQITLGIPFRQAFTTFSLDTKNKVIARSVELIMEAETSGGEIASILDQVVKSVEEIENLKKERKSGVYNMIIQGYMIFIIFIVIMLFVELSLLPMISGSIGQQTLSGQQELFKRAFFILMLVQAFFAGLVIGKLSEGVAKAGIKHSVILLTLTYFIVTGARLLF